MEEESYVSEEPSSSNDKESTIMSYQMPELDEETAKKMNRQVICWNCESIVMSHEDWDKVKCPICQSINMVPPMPKPNLDPEISVSEYVQRQYQEIICPICNYFMRTKKESDYVICTSCKNTVIIAKDPIIAPSGYSNIDAYEYSRLKLKHSFNPYALNEDDPLFLPIEFEKQFVGDVMIQHEEKKEIRRKVLEEMNLIGSKKRPKTKETTFIKNGENIINSNNSKAKEFNQFEPIKKIDVYKPLMDTINEITDNIKKLSFPTTLSPEKIPKQKKTETPQPQLNVNVRKSIVDKFKFNNDKYLDFNNYNYISMVNLPQLNYKN
jgi:LSD1 subclass zinc finger protein